jgi:hypothetical protein
MRIPIILAFVALVLSGCNANQAIKSLRTGGPLRERSQLQSLQSLQLRAEHHWDRRRWWWQVARQNLTSFAARRDEGDEVHGFLGRLLFRERGHSARSCRHQNIALVALFLLRKKAFLRDVASPAASSARSTDGCGQTLLFRFLSHPT